MKKEICMPAVIILTSIVEALKCKANGTIKASPMPNMTDHKHASNTDNLSERLTTGSVPVRYLLGNKCRAI